MKTPHLFVRLLPWLAVLFPAVAASAAFTAGGSAFTKRVETKLLAEPRALAAAAGKLGYGRKVKVEEVRGAWLRVSEGGTSGWVFAGNLSETKIEENKGADGLGLAASETTAAAAARPLTPAAEEYAARRELGSASEDLKWLLEFGKDITAEQVEQYLQENKKGPHQ